MVADLNGNERLVEIAYESMIARPAVELTRILDFVGVETRHDALRLALNAADKRHMEDDEQESGAESGVEPRPHEFHP